MKSYIPLLLIALIGTVWATNTNKQEASNSNLPVEAVNEGSSQVLETPMLQNFFEDFEAYTAGTQLTIQNSTDWTTWSGVPGSTEDPFVSNAFSYSGANSVVIVQNNDVVHKFDATPLTSGAYIIEFEVYIPSGQSGYFNTLAQFSPPSTFDWGMEVYFDVGGGGRLVGVPGAPINFSYAYDTWQEVTVIVDLDNDMAELWFEGAMVSSWQWTQGGTVTHQLDANDFFGAATTDEMYVDDYSVMACTPGVLGDANGDGFANSTDALIIQSYDAGIPVPQPILDRINLGFADANSDGLTNSTDALLVLSFDASIPVPFPVGDPICL